MVVDADIIIRFLTNDSPQKALSFQRFLEKGEKVFLTEVTIAEVYWTLKSFYQFKKQKIISGLGTLLALPQIEANKDLIMETFSLLEKNNVSFIDAYLAVFSCLRNDGKILSFDKGFDKLKSIKRIEP